MPLVCKSLRSPRSSLCKTAIMCLNDLFTSLSDAMLPWLIFDERSGKSIHHHHKSSSSSSSRAFTAAAAGGGGGGGNQQSLLMTLLQKAAQDKRFVADEAQNSLKTMSHALSPLSLLRVLHPCVYSPNPRIRSVASIHMASTASRLSVKEIREFTMIQLVRDGGKLLTDKLPDARSSARKIVEQMYALFLVDPTLGADASAGDDCGTATTPIDTNNIKNNIKDNDNDEKRKEEEHKQEEGGSDTVRLGGGGAGAGSELQRCDRKTSRGSSIADVNDLSLDAPGDYCGDTLPRGFIMTATTSGLEIVRELTADEQWCNFCDKNLDATTAASVIRVTANHTNGHHAAQFSTI